MSKKFFFFFSFLVLISTSSFAALCDPDNCVGAEKQIQPAIELLRGLNYKNTDVPVVNEAPEQAAKRIDAIRRRTAMGIDTLSGLVTVYKQLGALPASFDLTDTYKKINDNLSRSLYDPSDATIYITEPGVTPGWNTPLIKKTMKTLGMSEAQFILTRELALALIDQSFNLGPFLDAAPHESDRALAARALANGDATMLQTDFLLRNTGANSLALQDPTGVIAHFVPLVSQVDSKQLETLPGNVAGRITFPYVNGYSFVLNLRASGGWPLVNAAYTSPPLSTEQILHPEKYYTNRDIPISITTPPLDTVLGPGWKEIYNDVLGEFGIKNALETLLNTSSEAEEAAAGWGGDRTLAYSDGNNTLVAIYTTWDTPQDAVEYENALHQAFPQASASGPVIISAIGRDVVLLHGVPEDKAQQLLDTFWQARKNPMLVAPPHIDTINPDSPFFDQQLMMNMLSSLTPEAAYDPDFWRVDGLTFTSKKNGFRIKAPNDNWYFTRFTLGRQVVTQLTAFHRAFVGSEITLETWDKVLPGDPDPVDDMGYFLSRQMGKFETIDDHRSTIAGFPARETTFQGVYIVPIIFRYTELFTPEKTYVFTCAANPPYYKKLLPEFDAFINSFELLK